MAKFELTLEMEDADIDLIAESGTAREPHDEKDEEYVARFVRHIVANRLTNAKREKQTREITDVVLSVTKAVAK